jgi:hypothetical protein
MGRDGMISSGCAVGCQRRGRCVEYRDGIKEENARVAATHIRSLAWVFQHPGPLACSTHDVLQQGCRRAKGSAYELCVPGFTLPQAEKPVLRIRCFGSCRVSGT